MTLANVNVNDPVEAPTMNALINGYNAYINRAIFLSNTTWQLPVGVRRFKVWLAGGGGATGFPYQVGGGDSFDTFPGGEGGDSPLISAIFTGGSAGTSYSIVIGAGGNFDTGDGRGGTSTFAGVMSSTGGFRGVSTGGNAGPLPKGGNGSATFPPSQPSFFHSNGLFCSTYQLNRLMGFGQGASRLLVNTGGGLNGIQGVCVIEW